MWNDNCPNSDFAVPSSRIYNTVALHVLLTYNYGIKYVDKEDWQSWKTYILSIVIALQVVLVAI